MKTSLPFLTALTFSFHVLAVARASHHEQISMIRRIAIATIYFVTTILLYSCATVPSSEVVSPIAMARNGNQTIVLKNIIEKLERQFPELRSTHTVGGSPSAEHISTVWKGEEYAGALFILWEQVRYHPRSEFPRGELVPYTDIRIEIARYASVDNAQRDLERSLDLRSVGPTSKKLYKGASLYHFSRGTAICQFEQYVIEIIPYNDGATPLIMKMLDFVLGELSSGAHLK